MAKTKVYGTCHICLQEGELTFEHVPPRSAFNNSRVQVVQGDAALQLPPGEIWGGYYQQQGSGAYTLCAKCNNDTGSWYAAAFVHWCTVGGEALKEPQGPPKFTVTNFYPLRTAKQILAMFCSLRGPELVQAYPDIKKFLLDKERSGMPDGLRIFVHHALGRVSRQVGFAVKIDLNTGEATPMTELVFPPFGYLLMYGEEPPEPRAVVEITNFAGYRYSDCGEVDMTLPLVPTVSPFPADYRTKEELEATADENLRWTAEHERKQGQNRNHKAARKKSQNEKVQRKRRLRKEQKKARRKHR